MPNLNWDDLSSQQLGRYGEYYAMMEFTSYGLEVYRSEVDDHGVDFIAKNKSGKIYEVQVKSVRNNSYTFIRNNKIELDDNHLVFYIRFNDGELPDCYVFPATVWNNPNEVFKSRDYSKPEYGINMCKRNLELIQKYRLEQYLNQIQ